MIDEKFVQNFSRKTRKKDFSQKLGADERIILKWILKPVKG
jgi:hypothetical protein